MVRVSRGTLNHFAVPKSKISTGSADIFEMNIWVPLSTKVESTFHPHEDDKHKYFQAAVEVSLQLMSYSGVKDFHSFNSA